MQRVLVSEPIAPEGVQELRSYPAVEVVERYGLAPDELRRAVTSCAALLVRSQTDVTRGVIESGTELRVIGRAGAGVDNIDVPAATERGVLVMNTPGANAQAAAELTVGLMFAVARRIAAADASVKAGRWERSRFRGTQLLGKSLGIIGIGNVGRLVARSAAALGMHVAAHDPYVTPQLAAEHGVTLVSFETLLEKSDYISVHTPLTAASRGLIGAAEIGRMKRGVYLINCSRGGVIDEAALLAGLEQGRVAAAALDVYSREPPRDLAVARHPRVVATPHIGALSLEAQLNVAIMIANQIGRFLTTGEVGLAVNPGAVRSRLTC